MYHKYKEPNLIQALLPSSINQYGQEFLNKELFYDFQMLVSIKWQQTKASSILKNVLINLSM